MLEEDFEQLNRAIEDALAETKARIINRYVAEQDTVYALTYEHKHGSDLFLCTSEGVAQEFARNLMLNNLHKLLPPDREQIRKLLYATPSELTQAATLWAKMVGEYFTIKKHTLHRG